MSVSLSAPDALAPRTGPPLELWAALPAGCLALWAGPSWRDESAGADLAAAGLRPVEETASGIVVEPVLCWRLPARHPAYTLEGALHPLAPRRTDIVTAPALLELAYAATARAAGLLAHRRNVVDAMGELRRANVGLRRAEHVLGAPADARAATLVDECAALRADCRRLGSTPAVVRAGLGWFGGPLDALLPRTVQRLAAVRRLVATAGVVRAVPDRRSEVEGMLAGPGALAAFDDDRLSAALSGSGELLAALRLAHLDHWPAVELLHARLAIHPLRDEVVAVLQALRELSPATVAGMPRPGRHASSWPASASESGGVADVMTGLLLWTEVGRRLLGAHPLRSGADMPQLVVADAVRHLVGVGLDLVDCTPVLAALGDPRGALTD